MIYDPIVGCYCKPSITEPNRPTYFEERNVNISSMSHEIKYANVEPHLVVYEHDTID